MRSAVQVERRVSPDGRIGTRGKRPRAIRNVIVEQAVTSPDRHLAISENVIAKTNARSYTHGSVVDDVGAIPASYGHDAAGNLCGKISTRAGSKEWERRGRIVIIAPVTEVVVPQPDIQSKLLVHFPIVLDESSDVDPAKYLVKIAGQSAIRDG